MSGPLHSIGPIISSRDLRTYYLMRPGRVFVLLASMGSESLSSQTSCVQMVGINNKATVLAANSTEVLMKTLTHARPTG